MRQALLGADGGDHLGVGVDLDAEPAAVSLGGRLAKVGQAAADRVAMVPRVLGGFDQLVDHRRRRWNVGVAEAEIDDVLPGSPGRQLALVDGPEDIRGQVVDAAEFHRRASLPSAPTRRHPTQRYGKNLSRQAGASSRARWEAPKPPVRRPSRPAKPGARRSGPGVPAVIPDAAIASIPPLAATAASRAVLVGSEHHPTAPGDRDRPSGLCPQLVGLLREFVDGWRPTRSSHRPGSRRLASPWGDARPPRSGEAGAASRISSIVSSRRPIRSVRPGRSIP